MTYGHDRLRPTKDVARGPHQTWRTLPPDHRLALIERALGGSGLAA